METPIAVLAFNRPHYLKRTLDSLKNQRGATTADSNVFLFQDGTINPASGNRYATEEDLSENVSLFRDAFPRGKIFVADTNLGVALNFERAERYIFETLEAPVAFFLEDDFELGPFYLKTMHQLAQIALARNDIGQFAAYGDHRAPIEQQRKLPNGIIALAHNWAFGMTRDHWCKVATYVNQYLSLVRDCDYRNRPTEKIVDLFRAWGCCAPGTSQDVAKTLACYLVGSVKLNTFAVFGRYIGERGLHTTPEFFVAHGFDKTEVIEEDVFCRNVINNEEVSGIRAGLVDYCAPEQPAGEPTSPSSTVAVQMSEAEANLLRKHLRSSRFYLEFGCGGSTLLALRTSRGRVVSVDSDAGWIDRLKLEPEIQQALTSNRLTFQHVDIGPVGDWGLPKDESHIRAWRHYYGSAWTFRDFDYDLVLIDGRFRVMCALMAAIFVSPRTLVALHDYANRKPYFIVEKYFDTIEHTDRLTVLRKRANINFRSWALDFVDHMYDVG